MKTKPKIIIFSTAFFPLIGGAEVALKEITGRLKNRFDFCIVTARLRKNLPPKDIFDGIKIVRIGWGNEWDKWFLLLAGPWAGRKILKEKNNSSKIIWGMDLSQGSLAASFLKIFYPKIPFLFTLQYGENEERLKTGRGGMIGNALEFILKMADRTTVISSYLANIALKYGAKGKIEIISNGVDTEKFKNKKTEEKYNKTKIIITTSRLVKKNGVDVLIRAIEEVKKEFPDIKCEIIGGGPEESYLKKLAEETGVKKEIEFLGTIPHEKIPDFLKKADIFARPSRSEGMGNSFVEAMATGLPVIGTPVGGITDIIEDGKTGLFMRLNDYKDLSKKILLLLKDKKLKEILIHNGRITAEKKFSWGDIAEKFGSLFINESQTGKIKIVIATGVFPPDIGGPATYSKILADEFPAYGIQTEVVNFGEFKKMPKFFRHLAYARRIFSAALNSEIIFAQDPVSAGLPAAIVSLVLRRKLFLKIVGDYAWEQGVQRFGVKESLDDFYKRDYGWQVELLRKMEKWVAGRVAKVITPSKYLKKIVAQWGINPDKIFVVHNSFENKRTKISGEEARNKLGVNGKIIVSVGRLVPWKGFADLIEIMSDLEKEKADLKLVIIGDGPEGKNLRSEAKRLNLKDKVLFMGVVPQEKVYDFLLAGDVFVLNSSYEGLSHTLLEALSAGIPVIATDVGGNPEVIDDGKDGILVPYGRKDVLKESILRVLNDKELKQKFARNASSKLEKFFRSDMMEKTKNVLLKT